MLDRISEWLTGWFYDAQKANIERYEVNGPNYEARELIESAYEETKDRAKNATGFVIENAAACVVGKVISGVRIGAAAKTGEVHGNSLKSTATNFGYTIRNKTTDEILKFGETINPKTRYIQEFYKQNNAYMKIETQGTKLDIHNWQHNQILQFLEDYGILPPLNKSTW